MFSGCVLTRREFVRLGAMTGAAVLLPAPARGRLSAPPSLSAFVRERMNAGRLPGLSASVVRAAEVVWSRGYGWANLHAGRRVHRDTPFMLGSVSKTVVATAVMQAVEDGLFGLETDINQVLPFRVRLPEHPRRRITVRNLLTHTSGVRDRWPLLNDLYTRGDSSVKLGVFLRRYLTPGEAYYRRANFYSFAPGTHFRYSNVGASLAAYLVEAASGTGFDTWCDDRIFAPLGMNRTGWHLSDLPSAEVAMPYRWSAERKRYVAYGQYGYPDYPDGALRASASDVARHLSMFMGGGTVDGVSVLRRETVREMRRSQVPQIKYGQGLLWYRRRWRGHRLIGHTGGDRGVAAAAFYDPHTEVGVVVIGNGNWRRLDGRWALLQVMGRLFDDAAHL